MAVSGGTVFDEWHASGDGKQEGGRKKESGLGGGSQERGTVRERERNKYSGNFWGLLEHSTII